jgi:predicted ATPase
VWAARQEMLNWQFLQLDPVALRTPSNVYSNSIRLSADGSNLAAVLYRLSREDEFALIDISRDMANLVSGVLDITVKPIQERAVYAIEAHMADNSNFSSRVLSDGTLRLLTLVTLKNDPHYFGVLCLEEPENGVHPFRLKLIVELLQQLATDFEADREDIYPRQVLVNTHSPSLLPYVGNENVLFSDMRTIGATRQTRMFSVISAISLPQSMQESYYTLDQVRQFLDSGAMQQMREALTLAKTP